MFDFENFHTYTSEVTHLIYFLYVFFSQGLIDIKAVIGV